MDIRAAKENEVDQIVPLMLAYCDFYKVDHPDEAALAEMSRALIAAPDDEGFLLIGHEDGRVAGFAACGWKWSSLRGARIVVLEDLFVDPGSRGTGLADELIDGCADLARSHGAPALIWMTQTSNERAQAVYDRVGRRTEELLEYELEL